MGNSLYYKYSFTRSWPRRPSSFASGQNNQNPVAASAASEGSGLAWLVKPAPAECEKKAERGFSGLA